MITLTTPPEVNTVLGGNTPASYNKFVLSNINFDTVAKVVQATVRISSTALPDMAPIQGTLNINCATAVLTIEAQQLDYYRRVVLTGPQNTSVQTQITNAQNALESGLVTLGLVAGVQAPGA